MTVTPQGRVEVVIGTQPSGQGHETSFAQVVSDLLGVPVDTIDIIVGDRPDVTLVYLRGSYELIRRRMAGRHEHFMPIALLDSQFAGLQEPMPDEHPITADVGGRPTEIAAGIVHQLEERQGSGSRNERMAAAAEASTGERQ